MDYERFIALKTKAQQKSGVDPRKMNKCLRADQIHVTSRALESGRYAIFADCGLGKTLDELEWASQVAHFGPVLILAPLCVGIQTSRMAKQFGYEVHLCKSQDDVKDGVNVANYERLDKFDAQSFAGVVLDESSILKNYSGATRCSIIDAFKGLRFKLACSATPAPNDFEELGNHVEFLGIMTRTEMLSKYFVHDGSATQEWRLKGHAESAFWGFVATWSSTYSKPSDLNEKYSDEGFTLPRLFVGEDVLHMPHEQAGFLFEMPAEDLTTQRAIKRRSVTMRSERAVSIAPKDDFCVFWCDLNDEGDTIEEIAGDSCRQLTGSQSIEEKEEILWGFSCGEFKRLVTKQKITSFGLNWQHCNSTIFVGPNYSYEGAYQAIKRFHRFGQKRDVKATWVMMDLEYNVYLALREKMNAHSQMKEALGCK